MACFDDLINIRGLCEQGESKSSIWLDDIGITVADLEAFMTGDYDDAGEYFLSRYNFAVKEIEATIYNHFSGRYRATSLVDATRLGVYSENLTQIAGGDCRGIQLQFDPDKSFFEFCVGEISLYLTTSQDVIVEVWDLRQNKLLDSLTIAAVANEITTGYLHKNYPASSEPMNLFIGYNAAGLASYKSLITSGLCCGKTSCSNSYLSSQGVSITGSKLQANVTGLSDTAGLSLMYSLSCDHSSWICAHGRKFALTLAYKTASIMVSDALYNTGGERATNHHTINREELEKRYNFYRGKYNSHITDALSNMRLPQNRCFECNSPTRAVAFTI